MRDNETEPLIAEMLNEADLLRFFNNMPTPLMALDTELRFVSANKAYLDVTQSRSEDLLGTYVFDAFPEEDTRVKLFGDAFRRALAGEVNSLVREPFSIRRDISAGGGMVEVFWTCHHIPLHDNSGKICGMVQNAIDVTKEVAAERMRNTISHEFDHRVKNILSKVASIARITASSASDPGAFAQDFQARIDAMASTHSLLVANGWTGSKLGDLIAREIEPYENAGQIVRSSGPDVELSAAESQALSLALHELATNAAKYGAFSGNGGELSVTWQTTGTSFVLDWIETGMNGLCPVDHVGFGSRIIDQVLPMELGAEVLREIRPTGLVCRVSVPRG